MIMNRLTALAMVGLLAFGGASLLAGDKTQSRKKAKDGSGDNCTINAVEMWVPGSLDKTQSRKRAKDGSGDNCTITGAETLLPGSIAGGNGKCQRLQKRDGSCGGSGDGTCTR
ncbi:MAG: hypothetical protein HN904_05225 [Victivallales bacterium]|jgi:hypothetical protein|nr:hypothetical protein [Victivallales bacterium]